MTTSIEPPKITEAVEVDSQAIDESHLRQKRDLSQVLIASDGNRGEDVDAWRRAVGTDVRQGFSHDEAQLASVVGITGLLVAASRQRAFLVAAARKRPDEHTAHQY